MKSMNQYPDADFCRLGDGAGAGTNADTLSARMSKFRVSPESATLLSLPGDMVSA